MDNLKVTSKRSFLGVLGGMFILVILLTQVSAVTRSFSATTIDSEEFMSVHLEVVVSGGSNYYLINELVPSGFTVIDAGMGNTIESGHIKWVALNNAESTIIAYIVQAPLVSNPTSYSFDGTYLIDSMPNSLQITGQRDVLVNGSSNSSSSSSSSSSTSSSTSSSSSSTSSSSSSSSTSSGSSGGSSGGSSSSSTSSGGNSVNITSNDSSLVIDDELVKEKLEFKLINAVREKDSIKVTYSVEELSGIEQDIDLWILLLDVNNEVVSDVYDSKKISANSKEEFESLISVDSSVKGDLKLLIDLNSEEYSIFVQEDISSSSLITGFNVFGEEGEISNFGIGVGVVIVLFIIILVIFVKRILENRKDLKKDTLKSTSKKELKKDKVKKKLAILSVLVSSFFVSKVALKYKSVKKNIKKKMKKMKKK